MALMCCGYQGLTTQVSRRKMLLRNNWQLKVLLGMPLAVRPSKPEYVHGQSRAKGRLLAKCNGWVHRSTGVVNASRLMRAFRERFAECLFHCTKKG